ncbi:SRPBCC family protein [Sphingomonas sabuli]|uniref:SRPBCC family protein n=1 Tax=Sphingomonas sabuli TaxID=2764186 RepID=A0A7G9L278_9SPHN|nr:SRPBCC family protein [Sphingomonas sabuli]QNM82727.1 SRPBCC family protein [Sphingomonas sabuli]
MDPTFSVFIFVDRPVHEVFEAVADPDKMSRYFTTGGAQGRLETGATVTWDFHDFPGAFPVHVRQVVQDERIVFDWQANEPGADYQITVTMTFAPVDGGRTKVGISESGYRASDASVKASYGNCMGWSQMLAALKAWVEHGINLREGAYK